MYSSSSAEWTSLEDGRRWHGWHIPQLQQDFCCIGSESVEVATKPLACWYSSPRSARSEYIFLSLGCGDQSNSSRAAVIAWCPTVQINLQAGAKPGLVQTKQDMHRNFRNAYSSFIFQWNSLVFIFPTSSKICTETFVMRIPSLFSMKYFSLRFPYIIKLSISLKFLRATWALDTPFIFTNPLSRGEARSEPSQAQPCNVASLHLGLGNSRASRVSILRITK